MINIGVSRVEDVILFEVSGRVDSVSAINLGEALTREIATGKVQIVVDLSNVDYMSSAGLREIVSAYKKVRQQGGDLRLAQPSYRVQEVLELSGLDTIFQIFPSQLDAVGSY